MIIVCISCNAKNRVPTEKLKEKPQCGQCQSRLIPDDPIELNEKNFSQFIQYTDIPVIIDLWADWCGPCRTMAPHFERAATQCDHVIFAKLDTENNPRLSQAFNIRSIPTLVLMNKTTEIARVSGVLKNQDILKWLNQHTK